MNVGREPPARLDAVLRDALAASEPTAVPVFDHLWTRARAARTSTRRGWLAPVAALATLAAAAVLVHLTRAPSPEDDYRLARAVVDAHAAGAPTDRWLAQLPSAPVAGFPDLSLIEYPLIPEETFL